MRERIANSCHEARCNKKLLKLVWLGTPELAIDSILESSARASFRSSCIVPFYFGVQTVAHRQVFLFQDLLPKELKQPDGTFCNFLVSSSCRRFAGSNGATYVEREGEDGYFILNSDADPCKFNPEEVAESYLAGEIEFLDAARLLCHSFWADRSNEQLNDFSQLLFRIGVDDVFTTVCLMDSLFDMCEKQKADNLFFNLTKRKPPRISSPAEEKYIRLTSSESRSSITKKLEIRGKHLARVSYFTNSALRRMLNRILVWLDLVNKNQAAADLVFSNLNADDGLL